MISLQRFERRSSRFAFFSSHSHTISTFQFISVRILWFLLSRSTLRLIFSIQYSMLEDGHTNRPQLCLCQKHPFTKTTVWYLGRTMSGHPGNVRTFFRYRKPLENKYFLTRKKYVSRSHFCKKCTNGRRHIDVEV